MTWTLNDHVRFGAHLANNHLVDGVKIIDNGPDEPEGLEISKGDFFATVDSWLTYDGETTQWEIMVLCHQSPPEVPAELEGPIYRPSLDEAIALAVGKVNEYFTAQMISVERENEWIADVVRREE